MGRKFIDISGEKFNYLTVLEISPRSTKREIRWICRCDCGKITDSLGSKIRNGDIKSCGCKRGVLIVKARGTHGQTKSNLYKRWHSIISRCEYKSKGSERYNGRGISVCDEWRFSFENFRDWAINNGYEEGLTIDRIDFDGGYEPSNCRWVDLITQNNNRSSNVWIKIGGDEKTIAEWARLSGVKYETIRSRLAAGKYGFDLLKKSNRRAVEDVSQE